MSVTTNFRMRTTHDIPLQITSENSGSERRITPAWSISQLKTKLESVTGIPPSSQRLTLRLPNQQGIIIEAPDEEGVQLARYPLQPYAEINVTDTRPPSARPHLPSASSVPKYEMPSSEYEQRSDSVLAYKKANKLGRFDPNAPEIEKARLERLEEEVEERGIQLGLRCRVDTSDVRRGTIKHVGPIPEIPSHNPKSVWIGVEFDEPVGKNDGSIGGKKYFDCREKNGVFVRPDRVEVGDWPILNDLEEMEEI
ncbi:MAG: hypothetical protein M1827_002125 [Pycnora praestabilis]|nr:MAG: hypothetical protein M1827_002125 [Pycnora praestabilis]